MLWPRNMVLTELNDNIQVLFWCPSVPSVSALCSAVRLTGYWGRLARVQLRIDFSSILMARVSTPQPDARRSLTGSRRVALRTTNSKDSLNEEMKHVSLEGVQCSLSWISQPHGSTPDSEGPKDFVTPGEERERWGGEVVCEGVTLLWSFRLLIIDIKLTHCW